METVVDIRNNAHFLFYTSFCTKKSHQFHLLFRWAKEYPYCSVLVGSKNRLEPDLQKLYCSFYNLAKINN